MTRRIEPIDLMVAVGVFATIISGYFFFMAANGTLEAAQPELTTAEATTAVSGPMAAMEWVQPALGQALVQNYLLDRSAISDMQAAAKELNHVSLMAESLMDGAIASSDDLSARMASLEADHAARVQYVLGRSIVVFTGRGVRSGVLSSTLVDGPYNQRMIGLTEDRGSHMETVYQDTREPMLGHSIVAATQDAVRFGEEVQGRLGGAVVRVASLQEESPVKGEAQTQLALLALASIHTEEMADRFDRLAGAEQSLQPASIIVSEPRMWPEIPSGTLIAGSIGLIGLFGIGLMMSGTKPEEMPTIHHVPSEPVYRKTA